jgi:hypothetical protein
MTNDIISEAVDIAYTDSFNEVHELLEDSAIPTYYRIKTLVLLGLILADWEEANECRVKAEGK